MKIALVTDTHFGARSDSLQFDAYFKKFYQEIFFPKLASLNIKRIIHLGDCFDRRKFINFNSLKSCREYFFDETLKRDIRMEMIVGNHDTFFKNTNEVNSPELLLNEYPNIKAYRNPAESETGILFLPWICQDNYQQASDLIKTTKARACFGHLEIAGFVMFKGQTTQESHDGLDPSMFDKFELVCSGHYHHRHSKGKIHYLGNPYQMFWNDFDDPRGFHIFDTDTLELEFIENPFTIFEKYYYDDEKEDPDSIDASIFANKLVKLIVVNKTDFVKFDKFVDRIHLKNPIELKIIEDFSEFESEALDENIDLEDTMSLLSNYVDSVETDMDRDRLKTILRTLYVEAQHVEIV